MTATDETIVRHRTSSRRTRRRLVAKPPGEPRPGRTRERLQDLRILLDVARRISGHDSLDEIFEALAEMTSLAISCDRSSFFLNDSSTGELYSRVAQGVHRREIRLLNNEGIAGAAFQTGQSILVDDAYADPRFNPRIDRGTGYVTKTILCVPLRTAKGDVIGIVQALNKIGGFFTDRDRVLLEGIAAQSIVALQSSQTAERIQKARAQEQAFLDIVADITSQLDLDQLLQRVMTEATRILGAERSTLFLHDEKTRELFSRVAMGAKLGEIRFPDHAGIAGTVFATGKTVNIPHAYADLRFNPSFDKQSGFFTRSILCTPVINKQGAIIGVTQVLNKIGGAFSAEDESRLKAFTAQVAIALENAKLFEDVQKIKNYNENMLESMSNGVITLDQHDMIVTCNTAGARILKQASSTIVGHSAAEFFGGKNAWIIERIEKVRAEKAADVAMDLEIEVGDRGVSVNLTVLPLASGDGKQLGILLMIEGISHEEGMLDKFICDAIMAAFGLPIAHDDDEDRAVRAAIAMIRECRRWSLGRVQRGQKPVEMGIGLNTDMVVSGNIGSAKRMDYTLIGDGVNLASRLESACKMYSAQILISENTFSRLRGTYRIRNIDQVVVKGKTEPVGVYEVLDHHTEESFPNLMDVVNYFNEGMRHYRTTKFSNAIAQFEKALAHHPEDKLAITYVERSRHLLDHPPRGDWNGVWVMTQK